MATPLEKIPLEIFWWREKGSSKKRETRVPTNIHLDLLAAGEIPDPFHGMNERDVQWVHDKEWVYGCSFKLPKAKQGERIDLVFDGLDTFADVALNSNHILSADNMFIPYRVDITKLVKDENALEITFRSAYEISEDIRRRRGNIVCWNGHYGRPYVRKAQYHFGWDWGPSLVTCGPWKPIYIERYMDKIEDVRIEIDISHDLSRAKVDVHVSPANDRESTFIHVQMKNFKNQIVEATNIEALYWSFEINRPELWFPLHAGAQPLYSTVVQLLQKDGTVLDTATKSFGIRKIELVRDHDDIGSTFYFRVNNVPIFAGGTNWIPGDSFLPRITPDRYRRWIQMAAKGNQNIIRIWGGGIYEDDAFYDECDRQGVLVWQDFCFACAQYPADPEFRKSVEKEATAAIQRLRHHPCLALLAGNNEDYQVANEALKHDMKMPPEQWLNSEFPARYIYERLLPSLVQQHAPWINYWPGSPFGGVDNNSDRTIGDVHIWNVSSGMLVPYQRYPDLTARFVSEFGMLSCPHHKTVTENFFGKSKDRHPQSESFEFHCKASSYEKRMFTCMGEQFRLSFDLKEYVYLTQLLQSEAMSFAFRGWRRAFSGRRCGGAIAWQLNDCWPASSWALVDYYERPKPAYYTIARALTPLTVGVMRKYRFNPNPNLQHEALCNGRTKADAANVIAHATPHVYPPKDSTYSVWICNSKSGAHEVMVELRFVSNATGEDVRDPVRKKVSAVPNDTTEVFTGEVPGNEEEEPVVLAARLMDEEGVTISRDTDWPQPLKHFTFEDRNLHIHQDGETLTISAGRPVKGLVLQNADVQWSDNCIDVVPGDEQRIVGRGLAEKAEWIHYAMND
ncbi:beta-mannosidase [Rhizodiscina lignyota]|uniref:Beta-mannosidase B n=1 Tax=Rhizodiscina lignyota TaxID=1504668 RepID=A0A9P4M512_9PEZI|nr:beta-mannosidase [Rhizodiscina lignyota]